MSGLVHLGRALGGLLVLSAVATPPLIRIRRADEVTECERRLAALLADSGAGVSAVTEESFVCPRRDTPYVFGVTAEGERVLLCPNGHGQKPIPLHVWVPAP